MMMLMLGYESKIIKSFNFIATRSVYRMELPFKINGKYKRNIHSKLVK